MPYHENEAESHTNRDKHLQACHHHICNTECKSHLFIEQTTQILTVVNST